MTSSQPTKLLNNAELADALEARLKELRAELAWRWNLAPNRLLGHQQVEDRIKLDAELMLRDCVEIDRLRETISIIRDQRPLKEAEFRARVIKEANDSSQIPAPEGLKGEDADKLVHSIHHSADALLETWLDSKAVNLNALADIETRAHLLWRLATK